MVPTNPLRIYGKQLVVVLIWDPNTDKSYPALFALINSKDEEGYYLLLKNIKEIVIDVHSFDWGLQFATLDFEEGLQSAFKRVFPKTSLIGCLFHYRQALYRQAQSRRLLTEAKAECNMQYIYIYIIYISRNPI